MKPDPPLIKDRTFMNLSQKNMYFDEVFNYIVHFMKMDPQANYRLMVGTDSQVHKFHTLFVTGIVIKREGKGAWACILPIKFKRKYLNLHEKISMETTLTEQVASLFDEKRKTQLIDIILPHLYRGSSFSMEGHIDIGLERRSLTRFLANEMMARIESVGLEPVVKPESFVASGYANRYTKRSKKLI
ncbi:ribonuclease H-like YkuK family protein [Aquibacillus rhizosphaerae]|uniref:Ribonuclease H-like YkuK family protein n=1 Tax=Aquibacillus rhizosphaerae TaxID=3051431 RepID=A0ABT7L9V8_9BACI|nr:ribonuclease H-like YkuK family protein [Aquibacillus sp. LR5S19]MDL4842655.1 ribonuclease H-like YkuK family protein [Aquibacillus sp. LR5S19]